MDIVRTLGVAIDPTAARAGGSAVTGAFKEVGKEAKEMEGKVVVAGREIDKTGTQMRATSRAGDVLRDTLNRQNVILSQVATALTLLTARLNNERMAVAASTAEHVKAGQAMTRTSLEARNLSTAVDATAKKMREGASAAKEAGNAHNKAADQARDASGKFTGSGNNILGFFKSLKGAIFASGISLFAFDLARTEMQVQRTANALRYASADFADFNRNQAFVTGASDTYGLNNQSSSREFAKFMAAGKGTEFTGDQLRAVYLSVAKAASVLGLSAEETGGTLNALQQMISKGTVQAEELRGQLGERLPGAFGMAARAMGVTTQELGKMLEQGQVTAYQLLPALARELDKAFSADTERAAVSMTAEFNRMGNAWVEFKSALMESGVDDFFTGLLRTTTQVLKQSSEIMRNPDKSGKVLPSDQNGGVGFAVMGAFGQTPSFGSMYAQNAMRDSIAKEKADADAKAMSAASSPDTARAEMRAIRAANKVTADNAAFEKKRSDDQAAVRAAAVQKELDEFFRSLDEKASFQNELALKNPNRMRAEFRDRMTAEGESTRRANFTPSEKYSDEVSKLSEQYRSGAISVETFSRAVGKANGELEKTQLSAINDELDLFFGKMDKAAKFRNSRNLAGFSGGIDQYLRQQNGTAGLADAGRAAGITDEEIGKIEEATIRMERLRNIGVGTAQAIENGFSNFTDAMIQNTEDIGQAFRSMTAGILSDIASIVARQMIAAPIAGALSSLIGGVAGGLFGGAGAAAGAGAAGGGASAGFNSSLGAAPTANIGQFHSGGIVGMSSTVQRSVSAGLFTNAPRFHSGLKHDEFPAILQKGEEVVPKNQVGRDEGAVVMSITVNVNSDDAGSNDSNRQFGGEVARQIEAMIDMRIAKSNNPMNLARRVGR